MNKFHFLAILIVIVLMFTACSGDGTPLPITAITVDPKDPASVVRAFFINRSALDIDGAMQTVSANVVFENPQATLNGASEVRAYIEERANDGFQFEAVEVTANGNQVTFNFKVYKNGTAASEAAQGEATVQNGKITKMTLR